MSATYDRLAELPIRIDSYELTAHDREFGDFTRPSTVVHMHGEGQEGIGEDVVYTVLDHIAHRDAGPVHDLSGPQTLGEACELIGEPRPVRKRRARVRRLAPLPPLGLRVGGPRPGAATERARALREALGRDP